MPKRSKLNINGKDLERLAIHVARMERVEERIRAGKSIILDFAGNAFAKPSVANIRDRATELQPLMRIMNKMQESSGAVQVPSKPTLVAFLKALAKALGVKISKALLNSVSWDLKRFCQTLKFYAVSKPKHGRKYSFPNARLSAAGDILIKKGA